MQRQKNERKDEQISRDSPLSLTRYKSPILHCIPSLRLLAFVVPVKSLKKNNIGLLSREGRIGEQMNKEADKAHYLSDEINHHYCIAYQV